MNRAVSKNEDLHGNAPDSCPVVLLLLDVMNDLDLPGNSKLLKSAPSFAFVPSRRTVLHQPT